MKAIYNVVEKTVLQGEILKSILSADDQSFMYKIKKDSRFKQNNQQEEDPFNSL